MKQNKGSACGGSEGDRWFVAWEPGSLSWDEQYLRSLHVYTFMCCIGGIKIAAFFSIFSLYFGHKAFLD